MYIHSLAWYIYLYTFLLQLLAYLHIVKAMSLQLLHDLMYKHTWYFNEFLLKIHAYIHAVCMHCSCNQQLCANMAATVRNATQSPSVAILNALQEVNARLRRIESKQNEFQTALGELRELVKENQEVTFKVKGSHYQVTQFDRIYTIIIIIPLINNE